LLNFRHIEGQLDRWIEELSQYSMVIHHMPGKKHNNADALSMLSGGLECCAKYQPDI